jgi:hypothetical protein
VVLRRRSFRTVLAVVAMAGLSVVVPSGAGAGTVRPTVPGGADTPTFGVPRVVDPIHVYGEPDIAVNPKTGAIHASGPQGTGTQRSIWNISIDNGDSYRGIANLPLGTYGTAAQPTKSAIAPGGGDTEIVFDRAGKAYFTDLYALLCFAALTTDDDGATTPPANMHACPSNTADRQWQAVYDPAPSDNTVSPAKAIAPVVYLAYAGSGGVPIGSSRDGLNFDRLAGTAASSVDGTPVVDQRTGKFLMPVGGGPGGATRLGVGVPDAEGDLTFHYQAMPAGTQAGVLFPVLTQDTARNLYMVWIRASALNGSTQYQAWYTWAPPGADDEWSSWSPPKQISAPPANVNVFPWAQAGGEGILDVAWYGTDQTMAQLGSSGPSARKGQTWNLFYNQVTQANTADPVSHQVVASPHPIHYNDICLQGTGCITGQGNRNMADFFKITIGPDGRARIVYNDTSNGLVQGVQDTAADHQGAALVTIVTQNAGINSLTGEPLEPMETTEPVGGAADPGGDALFPALGGTNVPGADVRDVTVDTVDDSLVITATTGGLLAEAATAAKVPFSELVVRWQMGNTLYHAGVEMTAAPAAPAAVFFAGKTTSVDLCSVSGCKPNYLHYPIQPQAGAEQVTGSVTPTESGTRYTITVPLSAVGAPTSTSLLEEVMAFVTVSPASFAKPQDNALAFADEAPIQIEGTKTFNYRAVSVPADVPEVPFILLLPVLAAALLAIGRLRRRSRSSSA